MEKTASPSFHDTRDLKWKIGQMLAVGFPAGSSGLDTLRSVVGTTKAGNIILFSRNTSNAFAAREAVAKARAIVEEATGLAPFVAIDQEGGIVARLRSGVTSIPGAMAQAAAFQGGLVGLEDIENLGRICGTELSALGINWNLAPVADINVNSENPVIGVRSYGEDPDMVAALASAFARGLQKGGVMATAKHFPGHGDTSVDSHLDIPLVPHGQERLDAVELVPFRRLIAEKIPAIMTAHVRFPAVEPDMLPATLSPRVLQGLLRGKLGFEGIVCTDCMEMKAIAEHFPNPYAMAVQAGVDILFISHTPERQIEAASSIHAAVVRGEIPESRIDESVERILTAKAIYAQRLQSVSIRPSGENAASSDLAQKVSRCSLSVLHRGAVLHPDSGSVFVDVMPGNLTNAEDGAAVPSAGGELRRLYSGFAVHSVSVDPVEAEIRTALAIAESALTCDVPAGTEFSRDDVRGRTATKRPALIISLYAPSMHRGQMELLSRLAALAAHKGAPLLLILMRSPYDAPKLLETVERITKEAPSILCAFEYTELSAMTVAAFLAGGHDAKGKCPVSLPWRKSET